MATCGCMGQAVGTAAALCVKYDTDPADIVKAHMGELQALLLRDGQTIVGLQEPLDPYFADGLTIRASSQRSYEQSSSNRRDLLGESVMFGLADSDIRG